MQQTLTNFAQTLGFSLPKQAWEKLAAYADLVWQKKDTLNLTSVSDKNEIFTRHLADGMAVAAMAQKTAAGQASFTMADMGSGAGYIGLTTAILFPQMQVTLVESLQRRCTFLNWVLLKLTLPNVQVQNIRLGQQTVGPFDLVTERAMGQLTDILPLLAPTVKEGGFVAAYQSEDTHPNKPFIEALALQQDTSYKYRLPQEEKDRYLAIFIKHGHH